MPPLPATDLRSNLATWAVPVQLLPAVGNWMHDVLPNESYDPHFRGQKLETTYFDTQAFALPHRRHAEHIESVDVGRHRDVGERESLAGEPRPRRQSFLHFAEIAVVKPERGGETWCVEPLHDDFFLALMPVCSH